MEIATLKAEGRTQMGTRTSRALRLAGRIPAVVYGHGEPPESLSLNLHDLQVSLGQGARTLSVELGNKTNQYLIKVVQYDHLGDTPIHLDLTRVSRDERVKVRIGIELRGVPKGITGGGVLEQHLADIEVECLVIAIPDTLRPFVTDLDLGESLLVSDLDLPSGVVATADADERVATVREIAAEADTDSDEEEGADGGTAEPERIGRVRKEDEGSA